MINVAGGEVATGADGGDAGSSFGERLGEVAPRIDRRRVVGAGDGDGDRPVRAGDAVADPDHIVQNQRFVLAKEIEGLGTGVEHPRQAARAGAVAGQVGGRRYRQHRLKVSRIYRIGEAIIFDGDAVDSGAVDIAEVEVGHAERVADSQIPGVGFVNATGGEILSADRNDGIVVRAVDGDDDIPFGGAALSIDDRDFIGQDERFIGREIVEGLAVRSKSPVQRSDAGCGVGQIDMLTQREHGAQLCVTNTGVLPGRCLQREGRCMDIGKINIRHRQSAVLR